MNLHRGRAAAFVTFALAGCAQVRTGQVPVPSYLHDNDPDMRRVNTGM